MPRKNPLPQREKEVGARLREARERAGFGRVKAAGAIGIDSSKLYNYEAGLAATPYGVATKIAALADVNLHWIAAANLPIHPFFEMPHEFEMLIPKNTPLTKIFDRIISKNWAAVELKKDAPLQKIAGAPAYWIRIGGASLVPVRSKLLDRVLQEGNGLPIPFRSKFIEAIIEAGGRFIVRHEKEIKRFTEQPSKAFLEQQKVLSDYIKSALAGSRIK